MKLVIAEKPSVAISIAKVIGAKNKKRRMLRGKRLQSIVVRRILNSNGKF